MRGVLVEIDVDDMMRRLGMGWSLERYASFVCASKTRVAKLAKQAGYVPKWGGKTKSEASELEARYKACIDAGLTSRQAAEVLGVTMSAATDYVKKRGLRFAGREYRKKPPAEPVTEPRGPAYFSASPAAIERALAAHKARPWL